MTCEPYEPMNISWKPWARQKCVAMLCFTYCIKSEWEWQSSCHVHISAIKSDQNHGNHCTLYCIASLLSEQPFHVCLISVKANRSRMCLFNTWLSEMEEENVTG